MPESVKPQLIHVTDKELDEHRKVIQDRTYFVVKRNDLIQKSRYNFTAAQLKTLAYCISKIKPFDVGNETYTISIRDYQKAAGLNDCGRNYADIKENLKKLADASFWIKIDDKHETLFRWFNTIDIIAGEGTIQFKFHERSLEFLYNLRNNYTQYTLDMVLPLKSKYSIRLYELLISYHDIARRDFPTQLHITLEDLKVLMDAEHYEKFVDFRHRALDVAVKEICEFTDLNVVYKTSKGGKSGREVVAVEFLIYTQDLIGAVRNQQHRQARLKLEV